MLTTTHGSREERNDDTGACSTEYQATRDERPDAYPDSKGTGRFSDDRGQVRDPRLFADAHGGEGGKPVIGRRRVRAQGRRMARGRPAYAAQAAAWIGNGVLDRFLEDESLFGEFLRTPVSEGGVEPLVVEPPHVVVEVGA